MLWIEKYRPGSFGEIIGQEKAVDLLGTFAATGNLPHLLITGPHGTGKTAGVECLARALYGDRYPENLTVIQAGDLFEQGKKYLEENERYAHIYRKDQSLLNNFKNIIRWYASLRPLDSEFRMMVFEGASALTRESQQGLRRIMERYSGTCRFVYITGQPSGIIPAIRSRCLPVFFAPLADDLILAKLRTIGSAEGLAPERCPDDTLDLIAQAARGDLRKAIMLLQISVESNEPPDLVRWSQSETGQVAGAIFSAVESGDMQAAVRRIETLMIEYGLSAREVIMELRNVTKRVYNDPRISRALGETDYILGHCNNEYLQLNALVMKIRQEVFSRESGQ
ncbi:replication factor C small subunit [Methanolinea mesophila]|uniref:AAA family ATPase n=1 Tax=Methanolinea mesophila TaxID=547055 RepID=UPI001AE352C8|nr:AAA family ATPase [Methanolinea mesophila]MBP1928063.1 replication factor C small subunit [Methanolinea mesophila]